MLISLKKIFNPKYMSADMKTNWLLAMPFIIMDIFIRFADSPHQSLRDSFSPKGRSLYTLYHYTSGISTVIFIVFYLSVWYSVANKIYGAPLPEETWRSGKGKGRWTLKSL